jgi:hypothetical protein
MRPECVVFKAPSFDQHLCFFQGMEDLFSGHNRDPHLEILLNGKRMEQFKNNFSVSQMGCYATRIGQCWNGVGKVSGASVQIHHIQNLVKNLYIIKGLGATGRTGLKKTYI